MIKVTNLCKVFRTEEIETTALNGVTFEIKDGEFVAITSLSRSRTASSSPSWVLPVAVSQPC